MLVRHVPVVLGAIAAVFMGTLAAFAVTRGPTAATAADRLALAAAATGTTDTTTTVGTTSTASWVFAPAQAPTAPSGVAAAKFPVALGVVGDISFWAPNRGLLITAGTSIVPAGLYAYDGVSWHQLSTVCGGSTGYQYYPGGSPRIAWAGPDEFWTISDQRGGQQQSNNLSALEDVSLCHFKDGQVVASYAMPVGQTDSYEGMDAAACDGPDDCWFGGQADGGEGSQGGGTPRGTFHLYWNGSTLSVVWGPRLHWVTDMATVGSQIYEAVQPLNNDTYQSDELLGIGSPSGVAILHEINPTSTTPITDFIPIAPCDYKNCPTLPAWTGAQSGQQASAVGVGPVRLSVAQLPSSASASATTTTTTTPDLWLLAPGGANGLQPFGSLGLPKAAILRESGGTWSQVTGTQLATSLSNLQQGYAPPVIAAEPGTDDAWIGGDDNSGQATVERVSANGTVDQVQDLGTAQGVGARGAAQQIACPATNDCWLATTSGWLFHYTDGTQLAQDTDPNFQTVISNRPADAATPQTYSDTDPGDDSLANQQTVTTPTTTTVVTIKRGKKKVEALVTAVHTRMVGRRKTTLELTFTLHARAHIQLLAEHVTRTGKGRHARTRIKVVALTKRRTLKKGRRSLELVLSVRKWPNKLDLKATPVSTKGKR
jgi:hypothetical protein